MSFQPFSVQCLTCGSRLRVTDPAVVGTIAACPKCNSMVQIEREPSEPEAPSAPQQVAVGSSGVDSQAITQASLSAEASVEASTVSDAHGFSGEPTTTPNDRVPPDWESERTRRARQIALVAVVSATGLMVAILVFVWFVRGFQQRPTAMDRDTAIVDPSIDPTPKEAAPSVVDSQSPIDPSRPTIGEPADADSSDADSPDVDSPGTERSGAAAPGDGAPVVGSSTIPSDLIPQSPLDDPLVPTQLDNPAFLPSDPLANDAEPAGQPGGMQSLPPELEKYTRFLLDDGGTEEANLPAPPTMDQVEIDAAADQDFNPLGRSQPRELNLKADLGMRLALSSDGYPLADLMLLISQATGVPIQVDWVSFDLAGIAIDRRVATVKGWNTARELLDRTAESLGAEVREEETLIILTLADATFQQTIDALSDLSDFGAEQGSAIQVINRFLGADPTLATLAVGETREQQQLAGLAIEGLRRMRGVQAKVPDASLSHWAGGTESVVEWPIVTGGEAGPQSDVPITLASLLRRTARRNQATCVVNWYDATLRGARPEVVLIPHAKGDAATMLAKAMEPFQLQVRQVDAGHWWVGSEPTYDRLTAVIWTPPLGEAKQPFLQQIESIMQGASSDSYRLAYDQTSDRALLLLPRFIVRQLPKIAPSIAAR